MNAQEVKNKILAAKGQFVAARFKSNPKGNKDHKNDLLEKVTKTVVRAGIDYANLSSVKEAISEGERGTVGNLPWGQWKSFPYIIEHNGAEYLRLYPVASAVPEVKYYCNGLECSKDVFMSYLTPSDAKKMESGERPECFTIKAENLLDILE